MVYLLSIAGRRRKFRTRESLFFSSDFLLSAFFAVPFLRSAAGKAGCKMVEYFIIPLYFSLLQD